MLAKLAFRMGQRIVRVNPIALDIAGSLDRTMLRSGGDQRNLDGPGGCHLVSDAQSPGDRAAELGIRTCVVAALPADVDCCMAGLDFGALADAHPGDWDLPSATDAEFCMVLDLLQAACNRNGTSRGCRSMGGDCGDHICFSAGFHFIRVASRSLPGLGNLRNSPECCVLAPELS